MNYRICEKCEKYVYSTGKDYEDFIGSMFSLILLKKIDPAKLEVKGLCPFCNPKSIYNQKKEFYTKDGNRYLIVEKEGVKYYMYYNDLIPLT